MTKLLILLLLVTSCGQLPVDTSPAPIDNNQYNLELSYNNQRDLGLLGTQIDFNSPGEKYFTVPLMHKGLLEITSKRCLYSKTFQFTKKRKSADFYFKDILKNVPSGEFACIFNIYMRLTGMDKGFQGQFYVLKKEEFGDLELSVLGRKFSGVAWYQFSNATNENLPIIIHMKKPGILLVSGCGINRELETEGDYEITFGELFPTKESCVVTFATEYENGSQDLIEANFKVFSRDVLEIPDPIIMVKNNKIKVVSIPPVAYVGINGGYRRGDHFTTRYSKPLNWVRLFTANGRVKLLQTNREEIVWKPSIMY